MKKTTILFFLILFSAKNFAQAPITIQGTNQFPVAGDLLRYTNANTFGFDANGVGPVTAKVWDFSGLSSGTITDFNYVNPATLDADNGADKFPTANIARRETGATGYFYYQNTATNLDRLGYWAADNNYGVYTGGTKAIEFKFPITAGQSVNSSYAGDAAPLGLGEDSVKITDGILSISADMQGQLILPSATFGSSTTYSNVLRLKVIESFRIKVFAFGSTILNTLISDDYNYWFV